MLIMSVSIPSGIMSNSQFMALRWGGVDSKAGKTFNIKNEQTFYELNYRFFNLNQGE